jgi:uncharacterized protein involved in response to NO
LLVLHVGYLWLSVAFLRLGCSIVEPELVAQRAALQALIARAVRAMTLAVICDSLGHTGQVIETDCAALTIYLTVSMEARLPVAAPLATDPACRPPGEQWRSLEPRLGPIRA